MVNIKKVIQNIEDSKKLAGVTLNLENLGLTTDDLEQLIPIIAHELPNLMYLSLHGNKIESLPKNIGNLSNLLDLNCSNNNLKSLSGIEKLSDLLKLNIKNNTISMVPTTVLSPPDLNHVVLSKNPLSLVSLLNISTINNSQNIFLLDHKHTVALDRILEQPRVQNLASSVAVDYPDISIEQFNILDQSLSTDYPDISTEQLNTLYQCLSNYELRGIVDFELPLSELGIVLDSNGDLSDELSLRYSDIELSELLDKTAEIKEITGKTSQEAFRFVKNKSAVYLDGILNYGLSEDQMNQIGSEENIKDIYPRIGEEIEKKYSLEENKESDLADLTDEDKHLARSIFNKIIEDYIPEQARVENSNEQFPDQVNDSFASMPSQNCPPRDGSFYLSALTEALNSSQSNLWSASSSDNDSVSGKKPAAKPRVRR